MIARWFWREWRTPSMLIVWLALTLPVACVLALGTLSDRMEKGLNQQSRDFLAGDRVLRAARPVDERWLSQAAADGLTFSRQLTFMTMTFAGDAAQLARVKAADGNYPLYGALLTRPANLRPAAGEVLVAPRLLALKRGDSLEVGDTTLRVECCANRTVALTRFKPPRASSIPPTWRKPAPYSLAAVSPGVICSPADPSHCNASRTG